MPTHILKTDPEVFGAVLLGRKTYEIRINDRGFQVGDTLILRETEHTGAEMKFGLPLRYTGRECTEQVAHILEDQYGLVEGWCVLSFHRPVSR